jgi:hypothetical protein
MKIITGLVTIILLFSSCENEDNQHIEMSDNDWYNLISVGGSIARLFESDLIIYDQFENGLLSSEILKAYKKGSPVLGYLIQDSINNYILERKNLKITNRLDKILNIVLLADTSNTKRPYLLLSEPFRINAEFYCFSIAQRGLMDNHWIYFFERKNGEAEIMAIYEVKEDRFLIQTTF